SFKITQPMIDASGHLNSLGQHYITGIFDIDHGFSYLDPIIWGSQLRLYQTLGDGTQKLISVGQGWSSPDTGAGGSDSWLDDFLSYNFTEAGTYTIGVSNWLSYLNNFSSGIPKGVDYDLNISLEQHATSSFIFAPEPIAETGASSGASGQNVDDA